MKTQTQHTLRFSALLVRTAWRYIEKILLLLFLLLGHILTIVTVWLRHWRNCDRQTADERHCRPAVIKGTRTTVALWTKPYETTISSMTFWLVREYRLVPYGNGSCVCRRHKCGRHCPILKYRRRRLSIAADDAWAHAYVIVIEQPICWWPSLGSFLSQGLPTGRLALNCSRPAVMQPADMNDE